VLGGGSRWLLEFGDNENAIEVWDELHWVSSYSEFCDVHDGHQSSVTHEFREFIDLIPSHDDAIDILRVGSSTTALYQPHWWSFRAIHPLHPRWNFHRGATGRGVNVLISG